MFPSKEKALKIALAELPKNIIAHTVTAHESKFRNVYRLKPECCT